jgi:nitroreductase
MSTLIESLKWRYATKIFDPLKKVSNEDLNTILEAARLSASSYGLQPYRIFVVEDPEIREKLKQASRGQGQITDASHLIVFANVITPGEKLVDEYLGNVSFTRNIPLDDLQGYGSMMKSTIGGLSRDEGVNWTAKQAYIALGNLLAAAAELKIDTCPMEGFDNAAYDRILGLQEKGLTSALVAAIGYRSPADKTQHLQKVRTSVDKLYTHI